MQLGRRQIERPTTMNSGKGRKLGWVKHERG